MEKHHPPVALIEYLIEEIRNILLKWNTSNLLGKIIITFDETPVPDIRFQQTPCSSQISPVAPQEIIQSPLALHQSFSSHCKELLCQPYERSNDSYVHKLSKQHCQTLQVGCHPKSSLMGEENVHTVKTNTVPLVITEPTFSRGEQLLLSVDQTASSQCPRSTNLQCTHSTSEPLTKVSLPPFEKLMPTKNSHHVQILLSDSECRGFHESNHELKVQTLPQTCFNDLTPQHGTINEHSSHCVADEVMDPCHVTISSYSHCCNPERKSYNDPVSPIANYKRVKDKVGSVTGNVLEEQIILNNSTANMVTRPETEFVDGIVNTADLVKLNHNELIRVADKVLQREDGQEQSKTTSLFHHGGPTLQDLPLKFSAEDSKDTTESNLPSKFSTSDQKLESNQPSASEESSARSIANLNHGDEKEISATYRLRSVSRNVDMEAVNAPTLHSDNDQVSSMSKYSQNIKPLKKRTRLCTNFKTESKCRFQVTEGQMTPDDCNLKTAHPLPIPQGISISLDQKEKVIVKSEKVRKVSFYCKICMNFFTSRLEYRQHLRSHEGSFKCNICGKVMKTKDSLYHHQRGLHSKEKPYHCKDCNISFNFYHSYKLHLQRHRGERPHKCKYCNKSYLTLNHLKDHMQAIHSNTCIVCHVCGKRFSYSSALKIHLRRHSGEMPHKCSLCEKRFSTNQALKIHAFSHIKDRNFQCETCGKCFKSEYSRNFHSKKHKKLSKRFMCDICGKTFIYKCILDSHVQIHSKLRPYVCNICDKTFKSKASVYAHKYNVHKEGLAFSCSICSKSFKTKSCLTSHIKRHQNENIYTCSTCGATFPDKGGLSKHMRTVHLPHKCFICKICGKTGTRADNMRTHVKKHKNETSSSSNPMDFILEESTTDHLANYQDQVVKIRQRSREPKHRSSRKLYPTLETSDQNRWIEPYQASYKDDKMNSRSSAAASLISVLPVLSQGSTPKLHNDGQMDNGTSALFSQPPKDFESYNNINNLPDAQSKPSQFVSYFCQPDMANVSNMNFQTGPLTSLLSTISSTQEPEGPPPYSFVISPHHHYHHHHHHHGYQSTTGNLHPSEPMIQRPVESINMPTFGMNSEKTMTTLQNVASLSMPASVDESPMSNNLKLVQGGI